MLNNSPRYDVISCGFLLKALQRGATLTGVHCRAFSGRPADGRARAFLSSVLMSVSYRYLFLDIGGKYIDTTMYIPYHMYRSSK